MATPAKLAHVEFRKEQRQFVDAVLETAGNVIVVLDREGRIVRFNQAAEALTGYRAEELLGWPVWDFLIPPERRADVRQVFDNLIGDNLVGHYENDWMNRDGSRRLLSWRNTVLRDTEGQVSHVVALGYDITEQRAAQQSLQREGEQQTVLRELLETVLAGGRMEEVLERFLRRLFSVSWLAILPKGGVFLIDDCGTGLRLAASINFAPEIEAACSRVPYGHCLCGRAAEQRQVQFLPRVDPSHEVNYPGMKDHGHYAFPLLTQNAVKGVLLLYLPIGFQPEPEQERFLASVADILAGFICRQQQGEELEQHRHRLEELVESRTLELKESEQRFADFASASSEGVLLSENGRILDCNEQFAHMLGLTHDGVMGRTLQEFIAPKDRTRVREAAQQHRDSHLESHLMHSDGSLILAELRCFERDSIGKGKRFTVVRDITAQRRAEEQLRIAAVAFDSHEGIMVTDANKVILQVNRAFSRITGYPANEAIGKSPALLRSGCHDAAFYRRLWEAVRIEGHWEGEIWNRTKYGNLFLEWLSISAVRDPAGAVTHYVGTFTDISEPKEAQQRLAELAYYDPLTQLPNRRLLLDRLSHALTTSSRHGRTGALLMIDLDNFKTLNDSRGHLLGDQLLRGVANRLLSLLRESDTAARLGGDEFVVLLENLEEDPLVAATRVEEIAEKLRAALAEPHPLSTGNYQGSVSIGIALIQQDGIDLEGLLKQADLALYEAKAAGRNCIRFFDAVMQAAVDSRAEVEAGLRRALERGELFLAYQPQVHAEGRVTGAEALLRWQPPGAPMVSPGVFIPIAEESGLILPIGRWVLETACRQLARWAQHPETCDLQLAVNVSARQFRQSDFVEQVLAALEATGAPPTRLKLELTESLVLQDVEKVIATMRQLGKRGIHFSMDDFGTGYSSLAYLKRLPLDQLKIDQAFVRGLGESPESGAIVKAIIALGHSLGLEVIAEGVETEEQRRYLAQEGCMAYQGYLFGRPGPAEAVERMAGVVG